MAGVPAQDITDRWAIYNADCIDVLAAIPDASIHASIYSPPFSGLYQYSSNDRDLSNARDYQEFWEHYGSSSAKVPRHDAGSALWRSRRPGPDRQHGRRARPGRLPGRCDPRAPARGWIYVARHAIWKEPLAVRNRTMQKNLSHKTICDNAANGGVASADELLVFRKPGESVPIAHPCGLTSGYAGSEPIPADLLRFRGMDGDQKTNRYSHHIWRRYASSVWDDIRLDRVLPFRDARDDDDESTYIPCSST